MLDSQLAQQIINGVTLGCIYALIALGYTLIFGVMRLIFFAQGDLCMVGAFAGLGAVGLVNKLGGGDHWWVLIVAIIAAIAGAVLTALVSEQLAIRPLRQAARTKQLIASLGVSMILQNLCLRMVSAENLAFPQLLPEQPIRFGTTIVAPLQLFIVGGSLLAMIALQFVLHRTTFGQRLRAVAESPATAELDGISVRNAIRMTFVIGSILAAIAGVMMGAYDGVAKYNMGFIPGIKGFTAAILGGFGSPGGAVIGGLVLGIAETMGAGYLSSSYKDIMAFALLVLILVVRPRGLISRRS
jgi:branched-chain amino acid transport system permease protein